MKDKMKLSLLLFLSLIILSGCSEPSNITVSELETQFATAFPVSDMNKSLSPGVNGDQQSFALGSEIPLIVENKSSYEISFDPFVILGSTGTNG